MRNEEYSSDRVAQLRCATTGYELQEQTLRTFENPGYEKVANIGRVRFILVFRLHERCEKGSVIAAIEGIRKHPNYK